MCTVYCIVPKCQMPGGEKNSESFPNSLAEPYFDCYMVLVYGIRNNLLWLAANYLVNAAKM